MAPAPTLLNGFQWTFQFLGQLVFQWVPATVITLQNTGTPGGVTYPLSPVGAPASAHQVVDYLQAVSVPGAYDTIAHDWDVFTALSLFICLLLAALIIYCVIRILQLRKHEEMRFEAASQTVAARDVPRTQLRWDRIMDEAASDNEQNIRLAILEADIMLNELLDTLGYKGETMADKMRQVVRANFNTIDLAWEAHRARNAIAHQGSAAAIDSREAKRIINLYQQIFREFKFVE